MPGLPRPISGLPKADTIKPNDLFVLQRGDSPMSINGAVVDNLVKDPVTDLESRLKSGSIGDAELHLGFYLDSDGDLCQKED